MKTHFPGFTKKGKKSNISELKDGDEDKEDKEDEKKTEQDVVRSNILYPYHKKKTFYAIFWL